MSIHTTLGGPLLAGAALLIAHAAQAKASSSAVIRWDTYGVPHIYGPDVLTVERGLGYAQMEAHAETILNTVARARGRASEFFGAGDGNANITNDTNVRTLGIPERAKRWLAQGDAVRTPDGLTQSQLLAAFCAGANEYAQRNAATIDPRLQAILPIVPTDVTATEQSTIWFTFITNTDNIAGGNLSSPGLLESLWQTGGIAAANAAARNMSPTGSNGWALGRKKSATGNPILMGNPHLPWGNNQPAPGLGIYQWLEANLVVGHPERPRLNASGVTFAGAPFIGVGFNDYLGWTHTNNTIQASNLYQLTLDPTGTRYKFGGRSLPLSIRTGTFLVKDLATGTLTPQTISIKSSIQGPVIATSNDGLTALALRVAGLDQPSLITQYWSMIEARNLAEFTAADSMLQMPFFNVIYADRDGHILYKFGGRQPVRNGGKWADYSGILDGTDPTKVWTRTFTWDEVAGHHRPARRLRRQQQQPALDQRLSGAAGASARQLPRLCRARVHGFPPAARRDLPDEPAQFHRRRSAGRQDVHPYAAGRPGAARPAAGRAILGGPHRADRRRHPGQLGPHRRRCAHQRGRPVVRGVVGLGGGRCGRRQAARRHNR